MRMNFLLAIVALVTTLPCLATEPYPGLLTGQFSWTSTGPIVAPLTRTEDTCVSIKDPSIVEFDGKWHLFCTVRYASKKVQLEYVQLNDLAGGEAARRSLLKLHDGYIAAPQVFYFTPHEKWYLIYQMADEASGRPWGPWFSTSSDVADPDSWSAPEPCYEESPEGQRWLDFWIICDESKAHLFNTSNNGKMWRAETSLADFPHGWTRPEVVLEDDIFEASQTYWVPEIEKYLTIIEAQGDRRRYHKAYVAERLDGQWRSLAASRDRPLAAFSNVDFDVPWSTNISHGELIRAGHDERMRIRSDRLQLLYQGVDDQGYRDNGYALIPWQLGLATTR